MLLAGVLLFGAVIGCGADQRIDCREGVPSVPPGVTVRVPALDRANSSTRENERHVVIDGVDVDDELFAVATNDHKVEALSPWDSGSCFARVEVYRLRRYSHKGRPFAYLLWVVPHVGRGVMGGVLAVCLLDQDGDGRMDTMMEAKGATYGPDNWAPPVPRWMAAGGVPAAR